MRSSRSLFVLAMSGTVALGAAAVAPQSQAKPGPRNLGTVKVAPSTIAPDAIVALREERSYPKQEFTAVGAIADQGTGEQHVRLGRSYSGLPVRGGDVVVHLAPNETLDSVSQDSPTKITVPTSPKLDSRAAKSVVAARGLGKVAKAAPTLVVDTLAGAPRLAWEVTTTGAQADGTPSRKLTTIDAQSGATISSVEQIKTAEGRGQSLYSGVVPLTTSGSTGNFQLADGTRGGNSTQDVKNTSDGIFCGFLNWGCASGATMTDADNSWGNGAISDRASAAVDAQYGTAMTWDFFKKNFGRNGVWNDGRGSVNRVHYGKNYVNAFWDGKKMTYGDGDGVNYGPLTSLDVAAHEMTHGITENTANLNYSGESGGLNEATSDVFGTGVEFFANNATDKGDYLIGERFDLKKKSGLRRMDNPASDGKSANCWSSSVGRLDVHYSSGVGNHAFYLMAMGSGAKSLNGVNYNSPTCDGSSVAAIGLTPALNIWYRALSIYMTSSTNYAQARTAMVRAASDLYGEGSPEAKGTAAAWQAVNVQ